MEQAETMKYIAVTTGQYQQMENAEQLRLWLEQNPDGKGYLVKEVDQQDLAEAGSLELKQQLRAVTFGQFELQMDGKPVLFSWSKAKECLAYLIDRHGKGVTKKELAAVIFEDRGYTRSTQNYFTKTIRQLTKTLEEAGAGKMLIRHRNYYAVDVRCFTCDLYEYEQGDKKAAGDFHGEYMSQYSWGEGTLARL